MSSKQCRACVSGKEWSELERYHREKSAMSAISASNTLAPKAQKPHINCRDALNATAIPFAMH